MAIAQAINGKRKPHEHLRGGPPTEENRSRPVVLVALGLILAGTVTAYVALRNPAMPRSSALTDTNAYQQGSQVKKLAQPSSSRLMPGENAGSTARAGLPLVAITPREASPPTRELIASLSQLDFRRGINAQQAAEWQRRFSQLLEQKEEAIPAIREFLERNQDYNYRSVAGATQLGYPSLRVALLSGLEQIGGSEAIATMVQTLQATVEPSEIALLARALEKLAPDQFLPLAIAAAREALNTASRGGLKNIDVSPLFELLQTYGGAGVVSDLTSASSQWNYYATMALAQLPEGAGIPALIQMTTDPRAVASGSSYVAERLLAQLSFDYPQLQSTLLDRTRSNQIPASVWPEVGLALAGQRLKYAQSIFPDATPPTEAPITQAHDVVFGNQHFNTVSSTANLTDQQMSDQLAFVNRLLSVTSEPRAQAALLTAKTNLSSRLAP